MTIDVAIAAGLGADRVAQAFLPAYRAALRALVPDLGDAPAVLCVTEEAGNHPRAIRTTLSDGRLSGNKAWSTGAAEGQVLLVCARLPVDGERPSLVLVRVPANAPGVTVTPMPPTPFVPEVGHCTLAFDGVRVDAEMVLPGDGYAHYVKPFRTVEDIHVTAALSGFWLNTGRRHGWPGPVLGRIAAQLAALRDLAGRDPNAVATHLALGGVLAHQDSLLADIEPLWSQVEPAWAARWQRDRAILKVASGARKKRFERAVEALG